VSIARGGSISTPYVARRQNDKTEAKQDWTINAYQHKRCIYVSKTTNKALPDLKDMFCASIPADPYYEPLVHGDPGEITASDLQKSLISSY